MNSRFVKLTSFAILFLLVSITVTQTIPVFASSYGHPPSLGAGRFPFSDGLTINGRIFDISKFSQTIDAQNLPIGSSSSIVLKIFDNRGPTTIKTGLVYLNIHGPVTLAAQSDTWIKYDVKQGITVHDPHHLMGKVTASYSTVGQFGYMKFNITPKDTMDKSTICLLYTSPSPRDS